MLPRRSTVLTPAIALLALLWFAALPLTGARQPGALKPVPDGAAQGKAEITITRLYAPQFKAARGGDISATHELARELLIQGKATRDDYNLRFVALKLAHELGARVGDHVLALQAVGELAASFEIDTLDLKAGIYALAEKAVTNKFEAVAVTEATLQLIDEALAGDHFATAFKLLDVAQKATVKGDVAFAPQVEKRGKEILEAKQAFDAVQPFLAKVGKDDEATLKVARYYCFINGNYARGLPLLAKSADPALKELAARDLAAPEDPYTQALLADVWYELGRGEKGLVQRQMFRRARHWYQTAQPKLEGLTKVRVRRELEDLGKHFSAPSMPLSSPVQFAEITTELRTIPVPLLSAIIPAVSHDGKWIFIASTGGFRGKDTFSLWDLETGQKVKDFNEANNNEMIHSLDISRDKKFALIGGTNGMRLLDLQTGQTVRRFAANNGEVQGVHFLPDGKRVIAAGNDGSLRIFDLSSGDVVKNSNTNVGSISSFAVSGDGRRAITGGSTFKVNVWDLQTGQLVRQFDNERHVRGVALSPDGKWAVSSSTGAGVKVWDVEGGKELRALPTASTAWMALSPDGRRVYAVSSLVQGKKAKGGVVPNIAIQVFDLQSGQELRQLAGHNATMRALAVSPDGRWLVSVGSDGMKVWGAK